MDKAKVRERFSRSAHNYENFDLPQSRLAEKLFSELRQEFKGKTACLLDIGTGTGRLLSWIRERLPEMDIIGTWPLDGGNYCECEDCKDPQTVFRAAMRVAEKVKELFMWKREATYEEDIIIRLIIRQAWKIISKLSEINPSILDDFLWMFGRKTCLREKPMCEICPLKNACKAFIDTKRRQLYEHLYYNTWYY